MNFRVWRAVERGATLGGMTDKRLIKIADKLEWLRQELVVAYQNSADLTNYPGVDDARHRLHAIDGALQRTIVEFRESANAPPDT